MDWQVDPEELAFYLGRSPRLHLRVYEERPAEDVEDGCPGGYQHAPMLDSIHRFYRRRTKDGGRVSNPFFDSADDWLAQSAILYLEGEEEHMNAEWWRAENTLREQEAERRGR